MRKVYQLRDFDRLGADDLGRLTRIVGETR